MKELWGFDLTDISAAYWKKVLKMAGITNPPTLQGSGPTRMWVWRGKGIKIHTGNDPITGKFARGDNIRGIEKGYASYIGIYGDDEELVSSIADFIRKHGDSKDESPHASDFI
jgi:hypothetical protein